jgi:hypothetical protein
VRTVGAVVLACAFAGCATIDPAQQAHAIGSVAAEGALLAHDAAEGSSTATFVREHAEALDRKLAGVRRGVDDRRLATIAARVSANLDRLVAAPADEHVAGAVEHDLELAAGEAQELAR